MDISVLVPCYNAAPYLGEALESVFTQTKPLLEVIVIDDGSTDGSAAVAGQFGSRVQCHRQENQGISGARNRALSLARGEAIAFLDADDVWPEGSLQCRAECFEADPAIDCAVGLVEEFVSPELDEAVRRGLWCLSRALPGRLLGAMLMRRRVFDWVGKFDPAYRLGETIDWVARASALGLVTRTVDRLVLRRRIHASSTGSRLQNQRADYLHVLKASIDRRRAALANRPPR